MNWFIYSSKKKVEQDLGSEKVAMGRNISFYAIVPNSVSVRKYCPNWTIPWKIEIWTQEQLYMCLYRQSGDFKNSGF